MNSITPANLQKTARIAHRPRGKLQISTWMLFILHVGAIHSSEVLFHSSEVLFLAHVESFSFLRADLNASTWRSVSLRYDKGTFVLEDMSRIASLIRLCLIFRQLRSSKTETQTYGHTHDTLCDRYRYGVSAYSLLYYTLYPLHYQPRW